VITFLTLFLGLTTGAHAVELAAPPAVARMELFLDGVAVAAPAAPPWKFSVDFGQEPEPHRLVAVGYDAAGVEVARAATTVNLRPRVADLEVVVEAGPGGGPVARLAWSSAGGAAPERLTAWLDGAPLRVGDDFRSFPLPAVDLQAVHYLTVELAFAGGAVARAERVFGGAVGREISTENTAVAVEVESKRGLRAVESARGLFLVGGRPAEVLALEHGAIDLVAVRERSARAELVAMAAKTPSPGFSHHGLGPGADDRVFFVATAPEVRRVGGELHGVFPISPALRGGLSGRLPSLTLDRETDGPQSLVGAVAIAGMLAASGSRPRGVVLVLGPEAPATPAEDAARVRRFLARLRVPLAIWQVERYASALTPRERASADERRREAVAAGQEPPADRDRRLAAARAVWGQGVEEIGSLAALAHADRELRARLDRQRIVWIDGEHLPGEVSLAPGSPARFAGAE
jgi:hypothetical protein